MTIRANALAHVEAYFDSGRFIDIDGTDIPW